MPPRTAVLAALAALVLAFAALASGCGGSSNNSGVAALDDQSSASDVTNGSSGSSSSASSTSDDPQDAALKWARCMRKNGVDVPDPEVNGGRITMRARAGAGTVTSGLNPDSAKFRAAQKKCGTPFGNARPPMSEADRAELQESLLAFAKCMREHGVDMPDPKFQQGGGVFQIGGPGSGIKPDSPRFQAAQKACEPIMQKLRDKIGGPGPSTTKGPE